MQTPIASWADKLSVNHSLLDSQHNHLIELSNKFASLDPASSSYYEDFHSTLNDFAESMREHFETEEKVMESINYPELDSHKKSHNKFAHDLTEIFIEVSQHNINHSKFSEFLQQWLIDHVKNMDSKYAEYF